MIPMRRRQPAELAAYGLTREDYDELLRLQGGRCALCQKKFSKLRPACIDHDHRTGEIYGLLCPHDNYTVLGGLGRDLRFYARVVTYLMTPPARDLEGAPRMHRDAPPSPPAVP